MHPRFCQGFINTYVCLHWTRSSANGLLQQIKREGSINIMHLLKPCLQQLESEHQLLTADLLLQLDMMEDSPCKTIYREEVVKVILESVKSEECSTRQQLSAFLVSNLGGTYSWTGESYTVAWLVKKAGLNNSGDLRYCQKCSQYKPPRAHHCRICKRCVLRIDHHCIWINNCMGHANYKGFFVFVVYAVIACFYSMVLLLGSITIEDQRDEEKSAGFCRTAYVISGLLLFLLCMALSILLGWHIYLILQNKTTIEYHEGVRALWIAEKGGEVYRHPYNLGAYENLTLVLGPSI